jgi:hypothetical protein
MAAVKAHASSDCVLAKHQGAAARLEDEGVFDSSDDIDIIPDSDDDDQF